MTEQILNPNLDKSDLIEMFESLGYKIYWDFSKHDGLYWHELFDPVSEEMAMQVEFGISKDKFLSEWFDEDLEYYSFFVAGDEESEEYKRLSDKLGIIFREDCIEGDNG